MAARSLFTEHIDVTPTVQELEAFDCLGRPAHISTHQLSSSEDDDYDHIDELGLSRPGSPLRVPLSPTTNLTSLMRTFSTSGSKHRLPKKSRTDPSHPAPTSPTLKAEPGQKRQRNALKKPRPKSHLPTSFVVYRQQRPGNIVLPDPTSEPVIIPGPLSAPAVPDRRVSFDPFCDAPRVASAQPLQCQSPVEERHAFFQASREQAQPAPRILHKFGTSPQSSDTDSHPWGKRRSLVVPTAGSNHGRRSFDELARDEALRQSVLAFGSTSTLPSRRPATPKRGISAPFLKFGRRMSGIGWSPSPDKKSQNGNSFVVLSRPTAPAQVKEPFHDSALRESESRQWSGSSTSSSSSRDFSEYQSPSPEKHKRQLGLRVSISTSDHETSKRWLDSAARRSPSPRTPHNEVFSDQH